MSKRGRPVKGKYAEKIQALVHGFPVKVRDSEYKAMNYHLKELERQGYHILEIRDRKNHVRTIIASKARLDILPLLPV